jgi:hypothetical protein
MQKQGAGEKYQSNNLSRTPAQISIPISHYYSKSARGTKDITAGFNQRTPGSILTTHISLLTKQCQRHDRFTNRGFQPTEKHQPNKPKSQRDERYFARAKQKCSLLFVNPQFMNSCRPSLRDFWPFLPILSTG